MEPTCKSPIPGFNVFLIGPTGTGKTSAIRTFRGSGVTPFCIFTEPGFEVLGDIPCPELHWVYVKPAKVEWSVMEENHRLLTTQSFKTLADMAPRDKKNYTQFYELIKTCHEFRCDRCGQEFGDVSTWNTDRALCFDGLSGMNIMALREWVGSKSLLNQGDWGIAMNNLEQFVQKICMDTECFMVLIGHTEREVTEDTGSSKIMASTLGKKLAPKLPRFFSDVVLAVRQGDKFSWSTADSSADVKARNLPIADGIRPDFGPMIEKWKKQSGVICPTTKESK